MASPPTDNTGFNPIVIPTKFADPELSQMPRYKSLQWDNFLLTTFEKNMRPSTNDREYRLFKFDGYYYQHVWKGFIPTANYIDSIRIRGVIQSPNGKSFVIIGSESCVFVLKGNKCSQLLEGARFAGLGCLYYSHSTQKYYGVLTKHVSAQNRRCILTFAEISLNFNKSGDLPTSDTDIRQVISQIMSFTETSGSTDCNKFANMIAPDMLIANFSTEKSVTVSYINPDSNWKHKLKLNDKIIWPLHFDLSRWAIHQQPIFVAGTLMSINPMNPREMLYLCSTGYYYKLVMLVASETGVELKDTDNLQFSVRALEVVSYCIFKNTYTGALYHWSFTDRKLTELDYFRPSTVFISSSSSDALCYIDNKCICLRKTGFLDHLASSGGNLSLPVSRLISGFLKIKYPCT